MQDGGTPLFVACQGGHINMVKELIALGANVQASMKVKKSHQFFSISIFFYMDVDDLTANKIKICSMSSLNEFFV